MTSVDDSPVELRCGVVVVRGDAALLLQRPEHGDWVLAGGRPHWHDALASSARRDRLLPDLRRGGYARYLGSMWRPDGSER